MSDQNVIKRSEDYKWCSRQDLYDTFCTLPGITEDYIDHRIIDALETFIVRKGGPIRTIELWQKVGKALSDDLK